MLWNRKKYLQKPHSDSLAILEEYARETVLEAFEVDDAAELARGFNIRVNADQDSVESWFTYRVMGG